MEESEAEQDWVADQTHASAPVSDAELISSIETIGINATARKYGIGARSVHHRRRNLELKYKRRITVPGHPNLTQPTFVEAPHRLELDVQDGTVLVGSDGHYWPGPATTAHRAFVQFIKELKPKIVFMNGDAFDGARISRHPTRPMVDQERAPEVIEELEAVQERMHEIEKATPRSSPLIWPLGNHDARFSSWLLTKVPEFARVHGFHLKDHFSARWLPCWSCWLNEGNAVVKHRLKGGIHATHNATMWAGVTTVTGHLHSLKVTPFSDYHPRLRWGVDTGTLADPYGRQFLYGEDNPVNHRSGFIVLTFRKGVLLWPEIVHVFDKDHVEWRGGLVKV